jgi:beta-catenin-like protein 1
LSSRASVAELIGEKTAIIQWLLSRVGKSPKRVDQNAQYAAEVLAILLQSSSANRARLADLDGIDVLMQLLHRYSKRDPVKGSEEEEFAENLFNCLTCCVDDGDGKEKFLVGEGIELCIIMLRDGKWSRRRALRLLDHALAGSDAAAYCEHLVNIGGLKTVFGLFLRKVNSLPLEFCLSLFQTPL